MDWLIPLLSGACGAGIFSFIQFLINRRDKKKEAESAERKAMRYLMLYIIQNTARVLIADGKASMDDKRQLHQWHEVYHHGLGGNGDADKLIEAVDRLPFDLN